MKIVYFDSHFIEFCFWRSNWQSVNIGSGNGLVPKRRQAIAWINAEPEHWCVYAALGLDELDGWRIYMQTT